MVLFFLSLGLLILFSLTLFVFHKNKQLCDKIKKADKALAYSNRTQRRENEKIASLIHDKIQGDLIAIKNFYYLLEHLHDENEKIAIQNNLKITLNNSVLNLKSLSYDLAPPFLDSGDFMKVITFYFERINQSSAKHFSIVTSVQNFVLPDEELYSLYKIIEMFCIYAINEVEITDFVLHVTSKNKIEIKDNGNSVNYNLEGSLSDDNVFLNLAYYLKVLRGKLKQEKVNDGNHFVLHLFNN